MRRRLVSFLVAVIVGAIAVNAFRANAANLRVLCAMTRNAPAFELCGQSQGTRARGSSPRGEGIVLRLLTEVPFAARGVNSGNVGLLGLSARDSASAQILFEQRLAAAPGDVVARIGLAKALDDRGNVVEAAMQLRKLPYSETSARLVTLGQRAALYGGAAEALRCTALAVAVSPKSAMVRAAHGEMLQRSGRSAEALQYLDEAINTDPQLGRAYLYRGLARVALGWPAVEIEADFRRALLIRPYDFDTRYIWANWTASNGRTSEAISEYERLLRFFPRQRELETAIARLRAHAVSIPATASKRQR